MRALVIAKEWKDAVISGKKQITIREGARDYRNGPVLLGCNIENWIVMADIVDVRICPLALISEDEYKADGFLSRKELLAKLRTYYSDISDTSAVTVIRWTNVCGKLVDELHGKKRSCCG